MTPETREVGLDSMCLSYLLDALEGVGAPEDALAEQKVSLVHLYLYTEGTLWVTPTVETEFKCIKNDARRESHRSWTSVLFGIRPLSNTAAVERRVQELLASHAGPNDCRILAEAEDIGLATLLTFDDDLIARLSARSSTVDLARPAEFWARLAVPRGASPVKLPALDNPLANQTWWRW